MSSPSSPPSAPQALPAVADYLSFTVGEEVYAIDILAGRDIRAFDSATRIAGAPAFIRGVINLRGVIVPVVDLRLRFGLAAAECTAFTVLIVVESGRRLAAVVVDAVNDVLALGEDDIRPAPDFPSTIGARFIRGLATVDERMLVVLDIVGLMGAPETGLGEQTEEQP